MTIVWERDFLVQKSLASKTFTGFLSYGSNYNNQDYKDSLKLNKSPTELSKILNIRSSKAFIINVVRYIKKDLK